MVRLKIRKKTTDGLVEVTTRPAIAVTSDAVVQLQEQPNSLTIGCLHNPGQKEYFYQQNYNAIVGHKTMSLIGDEVEESPTTDSSADFNFSPDTGDAEGYYVSRIAGVSGFDTAFHVIGGNTFRWQPGLNGLALDDIGRPDIDCADYLKVAEYIQILKEKLDIIKDQIVNQPVASGASGPAVTYGLHSQYQAMLRLWNYLVYRMSVILEVSFQSDAVFIQGRYINATDENIIIQPCTVTFMLQEGTPAGIKGILSNRIRATSTQGEAPNWNTSLVSGVLNTIEPGEVGKVTWTVYTVNSSYLPVDYVVVPRQEVTFTLRLDLSIPWGLPDAHAVVGIRWPLDAAAEITIEKARSVFMYDEDIS